MMSRFGITIIALTLWWTQSGFEIASIVPTLCQTQSGQPVTHTTCKISAPNAAFTLLPRLSNVSWADWVTTNHPQTSS